MKLKISPLVLAFAIGCGGGGGGGVDSSAVVGTLSTSDAMALCNEFAADYPTKSATCDGETFSVGVSGSDCSGSDFTAPPAACTATVGEFEDCFAAEYADPCGSGSAVATACAVLETDHCEESGSD